MSFRFARTRWWNRVQTALAQWLTTGQTFDGKPAAAQVAVDLDGFHGVGRTTGMKATVLTQQGTEVTFVAA